jgi:hypothetical protein
MTDDAWQSSVSLEVLETQEAWHHRKREGARASRCWSVASRRWRHRKRGIMVLWPHTPVPPPPRNLCCIYKMMRRAYIYVRRICTYIMSLYIYIYIYIYIYRFAHVRTYLRHIPRRRRIRTLVSIRRRLESGPEREARVRERAREREAREREAREGGEGAREGGERGRERGRRGHSAEPPET